MTLCTARLRSMSARRATVHCCDVCRTSPVPRGGRRDELRDRASGNRAGHYSSPQRLAPFSYALGAEIKHRDTDNVPEQSEGDAFGRLILLHDPDGDEAWNGTMRLVAYIQADLDASEAVDPLLPEVAWSWLVDAINSRTADVTALGGTVTATTSVRYGDIAGPGRAHQLELRASWTATGTDIGTHVEAFCEVLEHAAGLPPVGVTDLGSRHRA